MSDFFASLWQGIIRFPYIYFITSGVLIVKLLFSIKEKWLRKLGSITIRKLRNLRIFAPNWVSIWRFPIFWTGFGIYVTGVVHVSTTYSFVGFCIMVFGVALDRLDGKIAAAYSGDEEPKSFKDTWDELNYPGKTKMGAWLDPLIDKLTVLPVVTVYCCFMGELWLPFGIIMLLLDLIGTATRPPFNLGAQWQRQTDATWFGKAKFIFQYVILLAYLPIDKQWMPYSPLVDAIFGMAIIFGVLSIISRL